MKIDSHPSPFIDESLPRTNQPTRTHKTTTRIQRVLGFDPIAQYYARVLNLYGRHLALPPFMSPLHRDAYVPRSRSKWLVGVVVHTTTSTPALTTTHTYAQTQITAWP